MPSNENWRDSARSPFGEVRNNPEKEKPFLVKGKDSIRPLEKDGNGQFDPSVLRAVFDGVDTGEQDELEKNPEKILKNHQGGFYQ